jgi:hypothetical protein
MPDIAVDQRNDFPVSHLVVDVPCGVSYQSWEPPGSIAAVAGEMHPERRECYGLKAKGREEERGIAAAC